MSSPIEVSGIGGKITTANISILKLSSCKSGYLLYPVPIATDHNIPEGLPLADPEFRQPGPIDLTLGVDVYSRVITDELLELGPNKPLAKCLVM